LSNVKQASIIMETCRAKRPWPPAWLQTRKVARRCTSCPSLL